MSNHHARNGQLGGLATVARHGAEYMAEIGRRGTTGKGNFTHDRVGRPTWQEANAKAWARTEEAQKRVRRGG